VKLAVQGIACLGSFGPGADALPEGLTPPLQALQAAYEDGRAAKADTSGLKDIFAARSLRHMDHFTRMALWAAARTLADSGCHMDGSVENGNGRTALVLATGYGPAGPTFDFLDSIIAHGDFMASPLAFSHSVHNIPAASIAMLLGLTGPCATVCQLDCPVAVAFQLAWSWLMEERVDRVLLGAADEHTSMLAVTGKGIVRGRRPESGRRALLPLGEGAAFFCLERYTGQAARWGSLEILALGRPPKTRLKGWNENQVLYSGRVPQGAFFSPRTVFAEKVYGNMPVAQAFDIILALRSQTRPSVCVNFGELGTIGAIRVDSAKHKDETDANFA
jgi:3-oxoacyl-[acyl-carrier-protein] synthase II